MTGERPVLNCAILLEPVYRDYVWGGDRLLPGRSPIAEAWVVFEDDVVKSPPHLAGKTLSEICRAYGENLLGRHIFKEHGGRFPLLIKLLDCKEWLSVQVHPDDEQSRLIEGSEFHGKTEAWHFLDTAPQAEIICGLLPSATQTDLADAIHAGTLSGILRRLQVHAGDSIFIKPGTIHALGPGIFGYEVQQNSDITYRAFDWNRPASSSRPLHIEKTLTVTDVSSRPEIINKPTAQNGKRQTLFSNSFFTLEFLQSETTSLSLTTAEESFHAVTMTKGCARIVGNGWSETLNALQTVLLPAQVGSYSIEPAAEFQALLAYIE